MRGPLGIIAGSGDLPKMVVEHCRNAGRDCFVVAFEGETEPDAVAGVPHLWIAMHRIGEGIHALKKHGVETIVLVGRVRRPELTKLKPDWSTIRLLASLVMLRKTGDDVLFKAVIEFLEGRGFNVVGVQEVLPEIMAPQGVMGRVSPDARAQNDMSLGLEVARHIGAYDIGQAVVVQGGRVIGVEAAEGTDQLLLRAKGLQTDAPGGVLVKVRKPQQDPRIDLPAVGPQTVEHVAAAGLRGIAIETGGAIIIRKQEMIARADALGVFLYGIRG